MRVYRLVSIICSVFWYCLFVLFVALLYIICMYTVFVFGFCVFFFSFHLFDLFVVSVSVVAVVVRVVSVFVGCMWYIETYSRHIVDIDSFMWVPFSKQYCRGKKVVNVSFCNSSRDICEYFG